MPTVKIHTPGVSIELEAGETSVTELGTKALELFHAAGGWPQQKTFTAGFSVDTEIAEAEL